ALGDVARGRPRRRPVRHHLQDAPRDDRRRLGRRSGDDPDGQRARLKPAARPVVVDPAQVAAGFATAREVGEGADYAPAADGARGAGAEQRGGETLRTALLGPQAAAGSRLDGPRAGIAAERADRTAPPLRDAPVLFE